MGNAVENEYTPTTVTPPGGTIKDLLDEQGMTQAELAERMGRSTKFISNLVNGEATLSQKVALELERVLNVPVHFWNNREQQYREALARKEEHSRARSFVDWMRDCIPVRDMINFGWIDAKDDDAVQVKAVLGFFGVNSPEEWKSIWLNPETRAAFRKTLAFASEPGAVATWLRYGEQQARTMHCAPYKSSSFKQTLKEIRGLSHSPPDDFDQVMQEQCRKSGVALVFTPQVEGARISGATRWMGKSTPLIQMSLRYKTDDHFWFTFFHEAGHVLLHGKRDVFLEGTEADEPMQKEQEADTFAANFLIPRNAYNAFVEADAFTVSSVQDFAKEQSIAPGIIVGRLQHDGRLAWSTHLNKLKRSLQWVE